MRVLEGNGKKYDLSIDIFLNVGFWALPFSICFHQHVFNYWDGRGNIIEDAENHKKLESLIIRILCIEISIEFWTWELKK